MILTSLGLAVSAAFAGAALYISWAEQPARLKLEDGAMLEEWKLSYRKGLQMQATLAVVAGSFGVGGYIVEHSLAAAIGGAFMLLNWPYTLVVMMPVNKRLFATPNERGGRDTRDLIIAWGWLHAVRTFLGIAGAAFLVGASA